MLAQITITVNEAKRIMAKGIAGLPMVKKALKEGQIFLKGGTTVSAVCEELVGQPLRISGRIVPEGTKMPQKYSTRFHCGLIDQGRLIDPDDIMEEVIEKLGPDDVGIIGANAIDVWGNCALMYGAALGGKPGRIISGLMADVRNIIIAAGLEKLVPGSITEIVPKAARKSVDLSMGMAVGLIPIAGTLITEKEAISLLGQVDCTVIGKGGVFGAEGATTLIIEGDKNEVERVLRIVISVKGAEASGVAESLPHCVAPTEYCRLHRSCIYRKTKKQN